MTDRENLDSKVGTETRRRPSVDELFQRVDVKREAENVQVNPASQEYRERVTKDKEEWSKQAEKLREIVKKANSWSTQVRTKYDPDKASAYQKFRVSLAGTIEDFRLPFIGRVVKEGYQDKIRVKMSKKQQKGYMESMFQLFKDLTSLTIDVDKFEKQSRVMKSALIKDTENMIEDQKIAIRNMAKYVTEVDDLNGKITEKENQVNELAKDEKQRNQYLKLKADLGVLYDLSDTAKENLMKETIKYDVAEDFFYETQEVIKQFQNTRSVMTSYNTKAKETLKRAGTLYQKKAVLEDYLNAGTYLVLLGADLDEALKIDATYTGRRIKNLSELVAAELPKRTYEDIVPIQKELSAETKEIIDATRAEYVRRVVEGDRLKTEMQLDQLKQEGPQDSP